MVQRLLSVSYTHLDVYKRQSWGEAPGDVFVYDDEVIIPGFSNGNLWITVQPPRGLSLIHI